jgi:hypothetical protein
MVFLENNVKIFSSLNKESSYQIDLLAKELINK